MKEIPKNSLGILNYLLIFCYHVTPPMKSFLTPLLILVIGTILPINAKTLGEERDKAVRLQIFLDQKLFGPGFIDGKPGSFTKKAAFAYNLSLGREEDDFEALQADADAEISDTYIEVSVPKVAKRFVNTKLPYKRVEQATMSALHYRSYYEFMAERYHTSESVLYELNGRNTTWSAIPGKTLFVPNVEPFRVEDIKKGRSYKADDTGLSERSVLIDIKERQVRIYEPLDISLASNQVIAAEPVEPQHRLIASFPTTPGREKFIHRGTWKLRNMVAWPTWRYDKKLLNEGKRSKEYLNIPGGPNNPVGVLWAGLSKSGIGIHGTNSPRTIGRANSSGCYRLANWDVARLHEVVRPGAEVVVK